MCYGVKKCYHNFFFLKSFIKFAILIVIFNNVYNTYMTEEVRKIYRVL